MSRLNHLFLLKASLCLSLFSIVAFAQEVPGDYQDVLKFLNRKGDFKANV